MNRKACETMERGWSGVIERSEGLAVTVDWRTRPRGIPIVA